MSCEVDEIKFTRGDSWPFRLELTVDGVADDLTGCTLWLTIKSDPDADDAEAELQFSYDVPAGADATAGIAAFTIPSDLTGLDPGAYYFDIQRVRPQLPAAPDVWTITDDGQQLIVTRDITRNT